MRAKGGLAHHPQERGAALGFQKPSDNTTFQDALWVSVIEKNRQRPSFQCKLYWFCQGGPSLHCSFLHVHDFCDVTADIPHPILDYDPWEGRHRDARKPKQVDAVVVCGKQDLQLTANIEPVPP